MRSRYLLIGVCLLLLAAAPPVAAQPPAPPGAAQPGAPAAESPEAADTTTQSATLTGMVLDQSGRLRNGVAVRLRPDENTQPTQIEITNDQGGYVFANVPPGTYRADVVGDHYLPFGSTITITGANSGGVVTHHIISSQRWFGIIGLTMASVLLFAFGLLAYRHHNIVHTTRELLLAQLENIETRLPLESDTSLASSPLPNAAEEAARLRRVSAIAALAARIEEIKETVPQHLGWIEWFFWSRGHEISGWVRLHEVERQLVAFLVPESRVVERAAVAEAQLRALNTSASLVLAERLRATLQRILDLTDISEDQHVPEHLLDHLKQQLAEGLTLLYDDGDTKFAGLMEWHNKAMWLVYLSLLAIIVLGLVFQHEELFVIGAAGGLMSRMARSLFREDVPSDYGASWTTLFLSPLLGAISAWVGIAMIVWLREIRVLGDQFDGISWDNGSPVWMIALGFTLGFSERFFTSLLTRVEGTVTDDRQRNPPVAPSPLVPGGGLGGAAGRAAPPAAPDLSQPEPVPSDRILAELDVQRGERAAFIGEPASPLRAKLVEIAGADAVFDATATTLESLGRLDAVLFESAPAIDDLESAARQLPSTLRPEGRVVVVGRSPAALFDADAQTQRSQSHPGPAVVREVLRTAGLGSEEPPLVLAGTDPLDWLLTLIKPAADLEEVPDAAH